MHEGILCFNVESEPELETLSEVASARGETARIAIRVNPDVDARTHAKISTGKAENKFGVPISRARAVYDRARALPGLAVVGVDLHIGSQITDLLPYDEAFGHDRRFRPGAAQRRTQDRARRFRRRPWHSLWGRERSAAGSGASTPSGRAQHLRPGLPLYFEPGRLIVGNAGVLVTTVLYVKRGDAKKFVIVDAAMNDLVRPTLYDAHHEIGPPPSPRPTAAHVADVVGPVCESGDFLALERELAEPRAGDLGGDVGRRLRRGAGRHLQFSPAGPGSAGQGRRVRGRPAAAELRGIDRPRQTSALVAVT